VSLGAESKKKNEGGGCRGDQVKKSNSWHK